MTDHELNFDRGVIRFTQDGNTLGTTGDVEALEIRAETQEFGGEPFFVLKTEGWSFDTIDDLVDVVWRAMELYRQCPVAKEME